MRRLTGLHTFRTPGTWGRSPSKYIRYEKAEQTTTKSAYQTSWASAEASSKIPSHFPRSQVLPQFLRQIRWDYRRGHSC